MASFPKVSQRTEQILLERGISSSAQMDANKLSKAIIPGTWEYNLTTAFILGFSSLGYFACRRMKLNSYLFPATIVATIFTDFLLRRQLDQTSQLSYISSGTLNFELEKYPDTKVAFENVAKELDSQIQELEQTKATLLA